MATADNERTVKVKHSTDLIWEAVVLSLGIYFGLQNVQIKVEVVVERPQAEQKQGAAPDSSALKRMM
jgi:hypothetical protein